MSAAQSLTCQTFIEFLDDFIDERLTPQARAEFDRHLAVCGSCLAYLESYRTTIELARETGGAPKIDISEAPEELIAGIVAALRNK